MASCTSTGERFAPGTADGVLPRPREDQPETRRYRHRHPPPAAPKGSQGRYLKLGRNKLSDLSIVGVTVLGCPDAGLPSGFRFRIALASVAPIPLLLTEVEDYPGRSAHHARSHLNEAARLAAELLLADR